VFCEFVEEERAASSQPVVNERPIMLSTLQLVDEWEMSMRKRHRNRLFQTLAYSPHPHHYVPLRQLNLMQNNCLTIKMNEKREFISGEVRLWMFHQRCIGSTGCGVVT
jgi:hypothetical protein